MPLAVCATPIGNLEDVTLRVLEELRAADIVLCEDTRHTRGLLERHGIDARLVSYHEHNEAARTAELLPRLAAGARVGRSCILNHRTNVDHESVLGSGVHLAPGATVCGLVSLGDNVFIAAGAVVLPRVTIGSDTVVPRLPAAPRRRAGGTLGGARTVAVAGGRIRVPAAAAGVARVSRARGP